MGEKSIQKKKFILEKAREVFSEKGYLRVTMKDIVDACQISRGGLYLYFDNVQEIFLQVVKLDEEQPDEIFSPALSEDASGVDILTLFLKEQKKEILKGRMGLTVALYEYYFHHAASRKNDRKENFNLGVKMIESLIGQAVEEGAFICDDRMDAARHIMYVLEGMRVAACTIGVTEEVVDREIIFLLKSLMRDGVMDNYSIL